MYFKVDFQYTLFMPIVRILSFKYAFDGIWTALKEEPNLIIHLVAAFIALLMGFYFKITEVEWLTIIITIGLVISLELTNTAIESIVDGLTQEHHPAAKIAKDISAGAVLVAAGTAAIVGIIIFLSYIHI